ncbi:hypothetical protein [Pseudomonas phage Ppu-503]|nr:hypothetical protein [Pseudomonas phage Ppu-503]
MHRADGLEDGRYLVTFHDTGASLYRADLRRGVWYWAGGVLPMTPKPVTWERMLAR